MDGIKFKLNTKNCAILGMLCALNIVLTRFLSISAWNIRIGFGFVPIALCGILYGPIFAGVLAGISDFLGAILFPSGPYFLGFTITAILMGVCFGLLLKKQNMSRICIVVLINQLLFGLLLNTFWIHVLYKSSYMVLLTTRVFQAVIMSVVEIIVIKLLVLNLNNIKRVVK